MPDSLNLLLSRLRALKATGPHGFEGLLRDLLQAITGQGFRLLKSGPQGGADVLQEPFANSLLIAAEARRYNEETALPLDALERKLIDAVSSHPGLDLWLLATTVEISATDVAALARLGDQNGIAVRIVDWRRGPDPLPPLAALCAAAPAVTRRYLGDDVGQCLDGLALDERLDGELTRLRARFTKPDIGYATVRLRLADSLARYLQDRRTAKAYLRTPANLSDPDVKNIRREDLMYKIHHWWSHCRERPLALVGREGMGKTWSLLSWWLEKHDSEEPLPLTVFVSAADVQEHDPEDLIADVLHRWSGLKTTDFWHRRLRLWRQDRTAHPKILLFIDGLNQKWSFRDWSGLLQPLLAGDWAGQVAIAMTCRTEHWTRKLNALADVEPRPYRVDVNAFSDSEVDALLSLHGVHDSDLPSSIRSLITIPRLFRLVIERRDPLKETGDITPERLIYEDWKQRISIHGSRLISDEEFRSRMAALGQQLCVSLAAGNVPIVTRRRLAEHFSEQSGDTFENLAPTLSELTEGLWMEPAQEPNHFRLNPRLAPYVLGLALVDALASDSCNNPSETLADFLDPLEEQDLAVAILRSATTIGLLQETCPSPVRALLLRAWIQAQNFRSGDFDAFWRLIPVDPELFLDLAEDLWLSRTGSSLNDEVLLKGFAEAFESPKAKAAIRQRALRWLSIYWEDPMEGGVLGYDSTTPEAARNRETTIARVAQWTELVPQLRDPPPIRRIPEGDPSWLAHRALGLLSFLPRTPFVSTLRAWALTRSIMNFPRHFEELAWVLRWNPIDGSQTRTAVEAEAQSLLDLGHPIGADAAAFLLRALATPAAAERAESIGRKAPPQPWPSVVQVNSETGTVHWDHQAVVNRERSRDLPLNAARDLSGPALDPDLSLPSSDAELLGRLAAATDASRLWRRQRSLTADDQTFKYATAALARWAPRDLAKLVRRVARGTFSRTAEELWQVAAQVPVHLLIFGPTELRILADAAAEFGDLAQPEGDGYGFPLCHFSLARLCGKGPRDQIDILATFKRYPSFPNGHDCLLACPSRADFLSIQHLLSRSSPTEELILWLAYLSHVSLEEMPPRYLPVRQLVEHEDARIRSLALEVICKSGDNASFRAVLESEWQFSRIVPQTEAGYGSLILCDQAQDENAPDLLQRLDPQAIGILAVRRPTDDNLKAFARFVREELNFILYPRGARTFPQHWTDNNEAMDLLVQRRPSDVLDMVQPILANPLRCGPLFVDTFPVVPLTRALLRHVPVEGARLWRSLRKVYDRGIVRVPAFECMPLEIDGGQEISVLRRQVLESAKTDRDNFEIAAAVVRYDRQDWLISSIRDDLQSETGAVIARAITFAGLLEPTAEADRLWSEDLASPPAPGWLARVHAWSQQLFRRNRWAHHWFLKFLTTRNADHAFACYTLFLDCVDHRALIWSQRTLKKSWDKLPGAWRAHCALRWPDVTDRVRKKDNDLKRTLYNTPIFEHTHMPWLD